MQTKRTRNRAAPRIAQEPPVTLQQMPRPAHQPPARRAVAAHAPAPMPPPGAALATADNGLDPADFDWVPVKRRPRHDGWTIDRQRRFIETLADTGSVTQAALEVGMTASSAYKLRRSPEGRGFAAAWDIAIQTAGRRLIDIAMDRVIHGSDEPVFNRDGERVGRRVKFDNRLLMHMLRAFQPDRFRLAHRQDRAADEALPPPPAAVTDALAALGPPAPDDPASLLAPDALGDALEIAEIMDGTLPSWQGGVAAEPAVPLGRSPEWEAELAAARHAGSALTDDQQPACCDDDGDDEDDDYGDDEEPEEGDALKDDGEASDDDAPHRAD